MTDKDFYLVPVKNRHVIQVPVNSLPQPEKRGKIFNVPLTTTALVGRRGSGKGVVISNILEDLVSGYPLVEKTKVQTGEGLNLKMGVAHAILPKDGSSVHPFLKFGMVGDGPISKEEEKKSYHRLLHVFIYSSTLRSDPIWKSIVTFLKKSGVKVTTYISSYSIDGKINNLTVLHDYLQEQDLRKETEPDYVPYDYAIVLDDLSEEIKRNSYIPALLKTSRHYSIRNLIISTQDVKDILPSGWSNVDNTLLFAKQSIERVEHFHNVTGIDLPLSLFIDIWKDATKAKHNFLWCDIPNQKFYKNFSEEYVFT